jgi:hypothetical protein
MFSPKANSRSELLSSVHAFEPGIDLALGLVPRHAVALLKPAAELRALTLDDVEIVVGEFAPLLLSLAFELFPIAFNSIPIHRVSPVLFSRCCVSFGGNVQPENPARQQKFRCADPRAVAEKDARPLLKKTRA